MSNLLYKKQVLNKRSFSIFPYNRIDLKNTSFTLTLSTKNFTSSSLAAYNKYITGYIPDAIMYTVAPTLSGASVAKTLPDVFPFKTSKFDISQGIPSLTVKAKRQKIPITSYDFKTRTYTLSNINIDFNYLFVSLKTRVCKKDLFEDVVIQKVDQNQKKIVTTTENWGRDITNTNPNDFYILTELEEVTDSSAGTWKLFPYSQTSITTDKEYLYEYALNTALNIDSFPSNDKSFDFNNNYSLPFNLYVYSERYAHRYFLPTPDPAKRKLNQRDPQGRYVTSTDKAFIEMVNVIAVPLSSQVMNVNTSTLSNSLPNLEVYNKVLINSNSTVSQLVSSSSSLTFIPYIQINSFHQVLGQNPSNFTLTNVSMLSSTASGLRQVNPSVNINYNSSWGKYFGVSDDNLLVSAPGSNKIDAYSLRYNSSYPYNTTVSPLSVITAPTKIMNSSVTILSAYEYGTNLVIDSRDKRKKSVDFYATSFKASLSGKSDQGVIEMGVISNIFTNTKSTIQAKHHIIDSNVPHLSSNSYETNKISKLLLLVDNSINIDSVVVLAAYRPNVPYNGQVGVIDIYGGGDSTSLKLLTVLNANNSSLSASPGVKFGTDFSGELSTLCVGVSSNLGSQVEVYELTTAIQTTTTIAAETLSGTRSTYDLIFNITKAATVINFEDSNDTSFGKVVYYDQALTYDPFFESQPLYTNRLFVGNKDKVYIFEDFNKKFLPIHVLANQTKGLGAYFNNFISLSSAQNKSIKFYSISAFEI